MRVRVIPVSGGVPESELPEPLTHAPRSRGLQTGEWRSLRAGMYVVGYLYLARYDCVLAGGWLLPCARRLLALLAGCLESAT
eukprot:COSAG01_NODE_205_length_22070_cov_106.423877_3_plen_82_part_00